MNGSTCCAGTGPVQKISGSALLPLVLLGVDVERLALDDGRALDGLPRRAVDAAEDDVDVVLLDELRRLGFRDGVVGRAVLEEQLERAAQQAALGVDVVDRPSWRRWRWRAHERERAGLVGDDSHLDGIAAGVGDAAMMSSLCSERCSRPERQRRRVVRGSCRRAPADTSGGLPIFGHTASSR